VIAMDTRPDFALRHFRLFLRFGAETLLAVREELLAQTQ
jgi:hypothetical protein